MFALFQQIWVCLIVDGFLLYLIVRIAGKKMEEKRKQVETENRRVPKRRGAVLSYRFCDRRGDDQQGTIDRYPCLFGRGNHCDVTIQEKGKNGKYFLSREYVKITNVKEEFRVTRCQKEGTEQKRMSGTADGIPFDGEISITFRENLELRITKSITVCLNRNTLRTERL